VGWVIERGQRLQPARLGLTPKIGRQGQGQPDGLADLWCVPIRITPTTSPPPRRPDGGGSGRPRGALTPTILVPARPRRPRTRPRQGDAQQQPGACRRAPPLQGCLQQRRQRGGHDRHPAQQHEHAGMAMAVVGVRLRWGHRPLCARHMHWHGCSACGGVFWGEGWGAHA
jgi:hypothetical protein